MKPVVFPICTTLEGRALARLLSGQKITHWDFHDQTATYRLSGYIENLRKKNWPVLTEMLTAPTNDPTGRVARYGRYRLEPEFLRIAREELGGRIERFIEAVKRFENRNPTTGK